MLKIEESTPSGGCSDRTLLPSLWGKCDLMRTTKNKNFNSNVSLGRVVIVSRNDLIRDFLGQIIKLHGYDCEYFEEWPKVLVEKNGQSFDALFIDDHFLDQCKRGLGHGLSYVPGAPLVVILGELPPSEDAGFFHVLKKPLDYRQIGRVMDECLSLKTQRRVSPDE
ncbi:hypothetical protein [Nitrospira sp. Ecomares 2.1]